MSQPRRPAVHTRIPKLRDAKPAPRHEAATPRGTTPAKRRVQAVRNIRLRDVHPD